MNDRSARAGLLESLRSLAAQLISLLATRGELASIDLSETRDRILRWWMLSLVAAVLLLAALLTLSLWVAALFWDGPRALAIGLLTAGYAIAGCVAAYVVRQEIAAAPPLFALTRAELKKDRDALHRRATGSNDEPR